MTRRLSAETTAAINKPGDGETRTEKLLRSLGVDPASFIDPHLPNGTFSHSQYDCFKNVCGQMYAYRYVEKLASPPAVVMSRGSTLHAGFDRVLRAKKDRLPIPGLEEMRDVLRDTFEKATENVEKWDDDEEAEKPLTKNDHQKIVLDAFEVFYTYALPKLNPVAVEKGFAARFAGVPYVGYIDLIDEVPSIDVTGMTPEAVVDVPKNKVVVDHKTTRTSWSQDKVDTNTQLTLYAAVEGTPHARIDQLVMLKRGPAYRPVTTQRTTADIAILEEDVADVVDRIKNGDFPKAPIGAWCCNERRCAHWSICRGKNKPPKRS